MNKRKELFAKWSKDRQDAYLRAVGAEQLKEVAGGWVVDGKFMEKLPFKGEALTSYLEHLYFRKLGDFDGTPGC